MLLALGVALAVLQTAPAAQPALPFVVDEATIGQIQEALRGGTLTCRQLVAAYLARIEAYDKNGPAINAVVMVNPEVLAQADALDARARAGAFAGPLHCVPLIV